MKKIKIGMMALAVATVLATASGCGTSKLEGEWTAQDKVALNPEKEFNSPGFQDVVIEKKGGRYEITNVVYSYGEKYQVRTYSGYGPDTTDSGVKCLVDTTDMWGAIAGFKKAPQEKTFGLTDYEYTLYPDYLMYKSFADDNENSKNSKNNKSSKNDNVITAFGRNGNYRIFFDDKKDNLKVTNPAGKTITLTRAKKGALEEYEKSMRNAISEYRKAIDNKWKTEAENGHIFGPHPTLTGDIKFYDDIKD